jgi:response regulator NasT
MSDSPAVRVVIADDEAIIRLDLKEILEDAGYEVVAETGRGDDAIELITEHQPDVAILDIKMPGIDGIEVARRISGVSTTAVLLLTAFSQRDLIQEAREAGVAAYLVKPYRKGELIPAIESVLARAHEDRVIDEEIESAGPSNAAEDKLETRRLVEQAKSILMDRDGLDEDAAFTLIQQRAMQTRTRMRDVAQSVVQGDAPER